MNRQKALNFSKETSTELGKRKKILIDKKEKQGKHCSSIKQKIKVFHNKKMFHFITRQVQLPFYVLGFSEIIKISKLKKAWKLLLFFT